MDYVLVFVWRWEGDCNVICNVDSTYYRIFLFFIFNDYVLALLY